MRTAEQVTSIESEAQSALAELASAVGVTDHAGKVWLSASSSPEGVEARAAFGARMAALRDAMQGKVTA